MENRKTVILQSHMDMVCDKLVDVEFDFDKDAIKTYVDGEWLTAEGTTLGADDGIGCAIELAILASDDIEHGPIECVFTRDEETGLTGAEGMKAGLVRYLSVKKAYPNEAEELFAEAQRMAQLRYKTYIRKSQENWAE